MTKSTTKTGGAPLPTLASLKDRFEFSSDVLDIVIGGKSSIDSMTAFQVQSLEGADRFIQSYGYDFENPIEKAEILGNFYEALSFVRSYFLQPENADGLRLEIPRKILELTDVRELFLMANQAYSGQTADTQGQALKNWACSLLKVMHTISHIDKDVRTPYLADIQKQIFDRFYKVIHRDPEGELFLGLKRDDPQRIDLVAFETKPKKSRDSIILKLLHKPENVAEDIFDRVGIRFISRTRLDALRIIKYLKDNMIIMPPNIKPSRSRNTLVMVEELKARTTDLIFKAEKGEISEEQLAIELEKASHHEAAGTENPHSSEYYRAIQFTCRQLIKLQNPLFDDLKELKNLIRSKPVDDEILRAAEKVDLKYLQREIRFFYPYEIQVMDALSAEENEKGKSAHSEYKRAQVATALKRVMGSFADGLR